MPVGPYTKIHRLGPEFIACAAGSSCAHDNGQVGKQRFQDPWFPESRFFHDDRQVSLTDMILLRMLLTVFPAHAFQRILPAPVELFRHLWVLAPQCANLFLVMFGRLEPVTYH